MPAIIAIAAMWTMNTLQGKIIAAILILATASFGISYQGMWAEFADEQLSIMSELADEWLDCLDEYSYLESTICLVEAQTEAWEDFLKLYEEYHGD